MKGGAGHARRQPRRTSLARNCGAGAVLAVTVVCAAACGGGPSTSSGGKPDTPLAFAKCVRAHGLPSFPDPDSSGQINISGIDVNSPQARHAFAVCGTGGNNGSDQARNIARGLKFARCMRAHGVRNFPDPNPDGQNSFSGGQQSPQFKKALAICKPVLSGGKPADGSMP